MKAYLCVGEYSSVPYLIQGLETRVYCMEELCYCLKENAFLLDRTLMNDELLGWIRTRCGLPDLHLLLVRRLPSHIRLILLFSDLLFLIRSFIVLSHW